MEIQYLRKAEADLSRLVAKTLATYSDLESKGKYVATAFVALVSGLFGVSFSSFAGLKEWQQLVLIGSIVPLSYCFYQVIQSLKVRAYKDGAYLKLDKDEKTEGIYLSHMVDALPSIISNNEDLNNKKGAAINRSFMALVLFGPLALLSGGLSASVSAYLNNLGFLCLTVITIATSAAFTVVTAKHIIPLINKRDS